MYERTSVSSGPRDLPVRSSIVRRQNNNIICIKILRDGDWRLHVLLYSSTALFYIVLITRVTTTVLHTHTLQRTYIHILMSYSLGTLQHLHTSYMRHETTNMCLYLFCTVYRLHKIPFWWDAPMPAMSNR